MNDFFIASNRPVKVGDLLVHQLQMHNFDEWSGAAQVIKDFLNNHSDETAQMIFDAHSFESTQLIAHCLKYSIEQVIELFKKQDELNVLLLDAVIKVNDAFFTEPKPKHRDDIDPRKKSSWYDVFQLLASNGHSHESIMQMSYGCCGIFHNQQTIFTMIGHMHRATAHMETQRLLVVFITLT